MITLLFSVKADSAAPSFRCPPIDLCLPAFPWADFRTTKGAIKLHVGLNYAGCLPEFVTITEGKKHHVTVGRMLNSPKGSAVAIDKAYNNNEWKQLTDKEVFFVIRLKTNAMTLAG